MNFSKWATEAFWKEIKIVKLQSMENSSTRKTNFKTNSMRKQTFYRKNSYFKMSWLCWIQRWKFCHEINSLFTFNNFLCKMIMMMTWIRFICETHDPIDYKISNFKKSIFSFRVFSIIIKLKNKYLNGITIIKINHDFFITLYHHWDKIQKICFMCLRE